MSLRALIPSPVFAVSIAGVALAVVVAGGRPDAAPTPLSIPPAPPPATALPENQTADLPPAPGPTTDQRLALIDRPLFSETRRPAIYTPEPEPVFDDPDPIFEEDIYTEPEPVYVAPAPEPPAPPDLDLRGIIRDGAAARALLQNRKADTEQWFAEGDSIDGWQITAIGVADVHLSAEGTEIVIQLQR